MNKIIIFMIIGISLLSCAYIVNATITYSYSSITDTTTIYNTVDGYGTNISNLVIWNNTLFCYKGNGHYHCNCSIAISKMLPAGQNKIVYLNSTNEYITFNDGNYITCASKGILHIGSKIPNNPYMGANGSMIVFKPTSLTFIYWNLLAYDSMFVCHPIDNHNTHSFSLALHKDSTYQGTDVIQCSFSGFYRVYNFGKTTKYNNATNIFIDSGGTINNSIGVSLGTISSVDNPMFFYINGFWNGFNHRFDTGIVAQINKMYIYNSKQYDINITCNREASTINSDFNKIKVSGNYNFSRRISLPVSCIYNDTGNHVKSGYWINITDSSGFKQISKQTDSNGDIGVINLTIYKYNITRNLSLNPFIFSVKYNNYEGTNQSINVTHWYYDNSILYLSFVNETICTECTISAINLTICNPNPANNSYETNFLQQNDNGLITAIDVSFKNFTTINESNFGTGKTYENYTNISIDESSIPSTYTGGQTFKMNKTIIINKISVLIRALAINSYGNITIGLCRYNLSELTCPFNELILNSIGQMSVSDITTDLNGVWINVSMKPMVLYDDINYSFFYKHSEDTTGNRLKCLENFSSNYNNGCFLGIIGSTWTESSFDILFKISGWEIGKNISWNDVLNVTLSSNTSGTWIPYYKEIVFENKTVYTINENMTDENRVYYWQVEIECNKSVLDITTLNFITGIGASIYEYLYSIAILSLFCIFIVKRRDKK